MSRIAARVSAGAAPPDGVVAVKNVEHVLELATLSTQEARIFASVLIVLCGTVPFPPGVTDRTVPAEISTRFAAVWNALTRPVTLVLLVPTAVLPGFMNW